LWVVPWPGLDTMRLKLFPRRLDCEPFFPSRHA